ncbi:uncharacterized protein HKW66_Vig0243790 [Vigna angularis]|uniref:Uncharacterized protein n=1 Tax=Phaseolus angularis TaxID=3914 RepID=A0A8T0KZS4_PHAAN|nr:uncharacterized protein HKW66_Vig0243790 [Vigna angularis]
MDAIEELTVDIGKREVVDLLKLSLISKNPLTDFVFEKKPRVDDFNPINQSWLERGDESSDEGRKIVILPIGEVSLPKYCFNTLRDGLVATSTTPSLKICDPKSCIGDSCSGKGFPKGPSTFMVTDDLVVTPMSSISAVSYLNRSQVPFSDLEERVISVGVKESLAKLTCDCETTVAENATRSGDQDHTVSLKVLVDKEKNKVVFTEAGKDFLDVLLSFLTLPLVTIARLVAKESNVKPIKVGSLSTSYEISDDLYKMPNVFGANENLFHKLEIEDMETLEEQIVGYHREGCS